MIYLALIFFSLIVGCSQEKKTIVIHPPSNQIFRMNLHSEPASLDPRSVRDIPTITTAKMFFDGLTRMNLQGEPVPSVASKIIVSPDKKTYTFILKETYWSNGDPVTAYDFEYAWKSLLAPEFPAEFAHQLFSVKNALQAKKNLSPINQVGIRTEGPKKLIIQLTQPNPYFLELTSCPITYPVPSEIAKKNPGWASEQGEDFVCNGPFQLVKWNHGNELQAKRNPHYFDAAKVKLDKIVLTMIEDEHTELNMYENNELDWAGSPNSSIPPEALPSLKNKQADELCVSPIAGTFCYKFNVKVPPFTSIKMRQAFALAIDRKSLIDNVLQSNQLVAKALIPPCMREEVDAMKTKEVFNKERSVALFEEALLENGWTRETLPEITLIFSKSEKHHKLAQAVQQEWNNTFNIKVGLQSYEWNTFLDHLAKGNYQVGGRGWISDLSDPKNLLEIYKFASNHSNNDTGWENPEFVATIEEAEKTSDLNLRNQLLAKAEHILLDEMPIAPLYHSTACYLKKPYVKDVYMSKLCDLDFKNAYIAR